MIHGGRCRPVDLSRSASRFGGVALGPLGLVACYPGQPVILQKNALLKPGVRIYGWFPPSFVYSDEIYQRLERLVQYLASSSSGVQEARHIVDFRDGSWYREDVYDFLRQHRWCLAWLHLNNSTLGWGCVSGPAWWCPSLLLVVPLGGPPLVLAVHLELDGPLWRSSVLVLSLVMLFFPWWPSLVVSFLGGGGLPWWFVFSLVALSRPSLEVLPGGAWLVVLLDDAFLLRAPPWRPLFLDVFVGGDCLVALAWWCWWSSLVFLGGVLPRRFGGAFLLGGPRRVRPGQGVMVQLTGCTRRLDENITLMHVYPAFGRTRLRKKTSLLQYVRKRFLKRLSSLKD
eukprot:s3193_g6.t1